MWLKTILLATILSYEVYLMFTYWVKSNLKFKPENSGVEGSLLLKSIYCRLRDGRILRIDPFTSLSRVRELHNNENYNAGSIVGDADGQLLYRMYDNMLNPVSDSYTQVTSENVDKFANMLYGADIIAFQLDLENLKKEAYGYFSGFSPYIASLGFNFSFDGVTEPSPNFVKVEGEDIYEITEYKLGLRNTL